MSGGISLISPSGDTHHILNNAGGDIRPNGIALENGGTVLLAHMGDTEGGIYRLHPDGKLNPVALSVEGQAMPPTNFVVQDNTGRIWITVSTRKTPRASDYRAGAKTGFIAVVEPGKTDARIVADGLGYTNECVIDEARGELWVNETFARRVTRYQLNGFESNEVYLSKPSVVCEFDAGTYPDGIALDTEGHAWITSIVSNRIIRVSPEGLQTLMFEDCDEEHLRWTEAAYKSHSLGREHLDNAKGEAMKNVSNLAFGGRDLKTLYIGNLLGDTLPVFKQEISGHAMSHWNVPLGNLEQFLD
ncbi:MAG: SMP-30/gluconolactonase/LRE family protein [Granulosicoccus sp.]